MSPLTSGNRILAMTLMMVGSAAASLAHAQTAPAAAQSASTNVPCQRLCLTPVSGLIGWWPGDGNAKDIQMASNGALLGGAGFAKGFVDKAFRFDGIDGFVNVPDASVLHAIDRAVTIDAWINPQLAPSGAGFVFARRDPLVSEGFSLFINNDGYLRAQFQTDAYLDVDSVNPVIAFDGTWKHVAVTADTASGTVSLYLNGQEVPLNFNGSISGLFAPVSHLYIGQRQGTDTTEGPDGALNFKGLIDEVQVYNRALSAAEIQAIFLAGMRGQCKPAGADR
jgi:Concanavalin A-like lectin/glucanases superfamily